jgi:hypothetical protein
MNENLAPQVREIARSHEFCIGMTKKFDWSKNFLIHQKVWRRSQGRR